MTEILTKHIFEPRRRNPLALAAFLVTFLLGTALAAQQQPSDRTRHVLFLHSFHEGFAWTDNVMSGFREGFSQAPGIKAEIHTTYMDANRIDTERYHAQLASLYKLKYEEMPLDLIVCADDPAFAFLMEYRDMIFPGVPVVFCGLNYYAPSMIENRQDITGVVEAVDIYRTIDAALRLHPKANQVVVINDQTRSGRAHSRLFHEKVLPYFRSSVKFIFVDDKTMDEIRTSVSELGSESIILLLSFQRDAAGQSFDPEEALAKIYANTRAPIYGVWEHLIGKGLVGGRVTSGETQGRKAAELAARILRGDDPATIPVIQRSPNGLLFDYRQLKKFKIPLERLPAGAQIINNPSDFLRIQKSTVWVNIALIVALLAIVTVLLFNIYRRHRAEQARALLEQQMLQAQKLESLGVMASGIAHDFNNLLMGILGNASLAFMEITGDSPAKRSIREIQKITRRASRLTNQLLAYSGRSKLATQLIDLSTLISDMQSLIERAITKKAVCRWELMQEPPMVEADVSQMRQVLMNLVTNASEAIDEKDDATGGTITIRTGSVDIDNPAKFRGYLKENLRRDVYAFIEISDTGQGLDEETVQKVFDPFYSTKFTGRGLGLAAVLGIVQGHEGAIEVESRPNRGTRIRVLFPETSHYERLAEDTDEERAAKEEQISEEEKLAGEGLVLVVDDEEGVRDICESILHKYGYSVITAADGVQGLNAYRENRDEIAAVVLDLTMPRMDGSAVLREIRKEDKRVPVLLSSGYVRKDATKGLSKAGYQGFIQKPYSPMTLVRELKNILKKGKT